MMPGRMCKPLASITCLPSGSVSLVPMATNLPSEIATPPCTVSWGVTTQPFFTTKSAFTVVLLRYALRMALSYGLARSVGVEHPLDVVGVARLGESEREQNACLPWLQIIAGDEAAPDQAGAADDPTRCDPAAQAHEC